MKIQTLKAENAEEDRATQYHALIGQAQAIPVNSPSPVISVSPVILPAPHRLVDLQMRVSAPREGENLPLILLSHGHGYSNNLSSLNGYSPLTNFWAAHGFIVIQPTHLSSKTLNFSPSTPGAPLFWRSRVEDMKLILDRLDEIEATLPEIRGRLDKSSIAVAGHSMGGHTASMLLGARLIEPDSGEQINLIEPRIKAGVLLAAPGSGGSDLNPLAAQNYPFFLYPSFAEMITPTLVVAGDQDIASHLTVRDADWFADPYKLSRGSKSLLTIHGGKHLLGGVSGYDAAETSDENPERVALIQRMSWAYLMSTLHPEEDEAWQTATAVLADRASHLGRVDSK
ncbi:MAG: alpha/beta fold hydrolase [Chloroflexota bacterium]